MKVFRSIYCSRTNQGYPLKKVEVLQNDENYSIILYDVGFEPPYWVKSVNFCKKELE